MKKWRAESSQGLLANIRWTIFRLPVCYKKRERERERERDILLFSWDDSPRGPGPPHYQGFMITLRHNTLGRIPLDEWSARHRDLYLTKHSTDKRQTTNHSPGWIRSHNPSKRAAAEPRLRPRPLVKAKNEKYSTIILPVLLYGCEPWWRNTGWGVTKIEWPKKIFGPKKDKVKEE